MCCVLRGWLCTASVLLQRARRRAARPPARAARAPVDSTRILIEGQRLTETLREPPTDLRSGASQPTGALKVLCGDRPNRRSGQSGLAMDGNNAGAACNSRGGLSGRRCLDCRVRLATLFIYPTHTGRSSCPRKPSEAPPSRSLTALTVRRLTARLLGCDRRAAKLLAPHG